jgi:hypothetical protein
MKQVRFSTVHDLFEAYPTASEDVGKADPSVQSLDFLRQLVDKQDWEPAISLCAYLLPRREAVAWGCRSLRQMADHFDASEDRAIAYAEEWAAEPEEWRRTRALALGNRNDRRAAATWLALAAGWSGGSVMPPEFEHREALPEQTAKAVRVALFVGLSRLARDAKDRIMTSCLEDGIQFVRGEPRLGDSEKD